MSHSFRKRIVANDAFIDIDTRQEMRLFGRPILLQSRAWTLLSQKIQHYIPRNTHWNDKGNQLAASLLLPWLEERISQLRDPSSAPRAP